MTTIERNTIGEGMFERNGVLLIHIVIPPAFLDLLRWLSKNTLPHGDFHMLANNSGW